MRYCRCLCIAALLSCVATVTLAQATTPRASGARSESASAERQAQASEHFQQGVELFREGAYRASLVELSRAHELAPDLRLLFNIGQAHLALGEYVETVQAFEAYLQQGGDQIAAARRADIEAQLVPLRKRTARLDIQVSAADAAVYIDTALVGSSPLAGPSRVSVGRHRVFAQARNGDSASELVEVASGDLKSLRLTLASGNEQSVGVASLPAATLDRIGTRRRWAIGLLSAGALLGAGAGVSWIFAKRADDDYAREGERVPRDRAGLSEARDKKRKLALTSQALGGTALALGVSSVVLFIMILTDLTTPAADDARGFVETAQKPSPVRFGVGLGSVVASGHF